MKHQLLKSIEALCELRSVLYDGLDPGVAAGLDDVIHRLRLCVESGDEDEARHARRDALDVVGRIVELVSMVSLLITHFHC
jgi:hypothetical protein